MKKKNVIRTEKVKSIEAKYPQSYTVGELISILKKLPNDYQFLCTGQSEYAVWIDHDNAMASIDDTNWIKDQMALLKENNNGGKENEK